MHANVFTISQSTCKDVMIKKNQGNILCSIKVSRFKR